jgi:hypothetical protein
MAEWSSDPEELSRVLREWSGDVLGRFALDPESVSGSDLYEAVACSWIETRTTEAEVFDPLNHYVVDLFVTP